MIKKDKYNFDEIQMHKMNCIKKQNNLLIRKTIYKIKKSYDIFILYFMEKILNLILILA